MNDDALKQLWKGQSLGPLPELPDEAQIAAMKARMKGFDRTIDGRDLGEVVACVFIALFFGFQLMFRDLSLLTQAGCVVLVASSIFISWRLLVSKRRLPKAAPDAPLFDVARVELRKVENQIGLLQSVAWWYLLPLFVGVMLFHWGGSDSIVLSLFYTAGVIALFVFIHRLNQRAVRKNLLPLKRDLASLVHSAETDEPLDPANLAGFRQAALSMCAGIPVDAARFKVSFWQVAFYGEIGFIGIWFFLMLGVTKGNLFEVFSPERLVWVGPFFLGGLLYARWLQKMTEDAVAIGPRGVYLNKGQQLICWDDIKEIRLFKLLNIRSLWLIPETGEKTILPWTGLERHVELKAAVERFAPADHPIRDHVSLLRTEANQKTIMKKVILAGIVLIALGAIVLSRTNESAPPPIEYSDPVSKMLEDVRVKHGFPALAAAVVVEGRIVVTNAVGFRKSGGPEQVTADDRFHIGSVTKSMTATVAAMLVEQGKISWQTTIGEALPGLKSGVHADYLGVTLEQLLSHRSGAPGDAPADLWFKAWRATGSPAEQRMEFVKGLLARKPESKPGSKYAYSNQGYTIAGVMLEKAAGKTWEDLLRSRLFEPLGMTTAGFGAPASLGKVDQPWGHEKGMLAGLKPVSPGPRADNPLAISPAGAVHCSMGDLAKYAAFHMAGERGESDLLKAESFKKLHTIAAGNDNYALGWLLLKRSWANGRALMHNGSNTMFYVVVWMALEKNCAVVVATNVGVSAGFKGCDEVAGNLIRQYFGE